MSVHRVAIGKRLRFQIFARDEFTCRYCGRKSDAVQLHVDHVVPVAEGGTNDIENLVTSCVECNLGKGAKPLNQHVPTDMDRLRMLQEFREQQEQIVLAGKARDAQQGARQYLVNYVCTACGVEETPKEGINILMRFMAEHGAKEVCRWIDIAEHGCRSYGSEKPSPYNLVRYVCGIRKKVLNGTALPSAPGKLQAEAGGDQ